MPETGDRQKCKKIFMEALRKPLGLPISFIGPPNNDNKW
jgi:hypothetical protein